MESFGSGRTHGNSVAGFTLILKRFVWPHRGTRVFLGGSFTSYSDADAHYTRLRDQSLSFLISTTQRSPLGVLMRQGYALSSVEGRVVMEFFDLSEASQAKIYGTFATGVCDGCVNVWDGNN
ncbi:hypothetical protein JHK87_029143 [Glycine soja]|nr:hypothetical protein JHK87_029143 [Glycine soja]